MTPIRLLLLALPLGAAAGCLSPPPLDAAAAYHCITEDDCAGWRCWSGGVAPTASSPGVCVPEIACTSLADPACDDGLPCTEDRCDLASASCVNAPSEGACFDGERCGCAHLDALDACRVGVCDGGVCRETIAPAGTFCTAPSCLDEGTWAAAFCDGSGAACPSEIVDVCEASPAERGVCVDPLLGCEAVSRPSWEGLTGGWAGLWWRVREVDGAPTWTALTWAADAEGPVWVTLWAPDGTVVGVPKEHGIALAADRLHLDVAMTGTTTIAPLVSDESLVLGTAGLEGRQLVQIRRAAAPGSPRPGVWSVVTVGDADAPGGSITVGRGELEVRDDAAGACAAFIGEGAGPGPGCLPLIAHPYADLQLVTATERWWGWVDASRDAMIWMRERPTGVAGWQRVGVAIALRRPDVAEADRRLGAAYELHGVRMGAGGPESRWLALGLGEDGQATDRAAWRAEAGCAAAADLSSARLTVEGGDLVAALTLDGHEETWRGPIAAVLPGRAVALAVLTPDDGGEGVLHAAWRPGDEPIEPPRWCGPWR